MEAKCGVKVDAKLEQAAICGIILVQLANLSSCATAYPVFHGSSGWSMVVTKQRCSTMRRRKQDA